MKNLLKRLREAVTAGATYAVAYVRVLLATEPVRVRAWLMSAIGAGSVLIPALSNASTVGQVVGVLMVLLPVLLGETARAKVSPTATADEPVSE
ncbi:hypothetical protein [Kitasatospora fiedleri]|uniref:hypothetical protein n=1 Tax=Kitasatospora fiedleri TaxID=2991545 RepID=UPI002499B817|nr:hypothetical protein [Kitasatospora fiedleri]